MSLAVHPTTPRFKGVDINFKQNKVTVKCTGALTIYQITDKPFSMALRGSLPASWAGLVAEVEDDAGFAQRQQTVKTQKRQIGKGLADVLQTAFGRCLHCMRQPERNFLGNLRRGNFKIEVERPKPSSPEVQAILDEKD